MKLDIQLFGGRGASSSNRIDGVRALSNKAKNIMRDWTKTQQATEESEKQMQKELNKMSFNDLLKIAQRIEEFDYARTEIGTAFALDVLSDNVYEVGQKKNPNKWSIEYGKWREERK